MVGSGRESLGRNQTGQAYWRELVEKSPHGQFLRYGNDTWSLSEGDEIVQRLAAGLYELGIRTGSTVAVGMSNVPEALLMHIALREIGAVNVALVPTLTYQELAYQLVHSGAQYLVMNDPVVSTIEPHLSNFTQLQAIAIMSSHSRSFEDNRCLDFQTLLEARPRKEAHQGPKSDLAASAILYTSGSTSRPKAVVLPAGSVVTCGNGYASRFGIKSTDRFLLPFTIAHGVGALVVQGLQLATGCEIVLEERFSAQNFWNAVSAAEATSTLLFPAQLNILISQRNETAATQNSLRVVITHTANEQFCETFGVELGLVWGATETGAIGSGASPRSKWDRADGLIGQPFDGVEIEVFDKQGSQLEPGIEGELCVRHSHVMLEYLNDEEATRETIRDGWVATGDIGLKDDQGTLHYRRRDKSMIKRSGENISPEEVEEIIQSHDDVIECVVYGVPDAVRTEEVAARIVTRRESDLTPEKLCEYIGNQASKWKIPRFIAMDKEELPRLASGKINRRAISNSFTGTDYWDASK